MSCTVVTPSSSCASPPKSSLMYTSSGRYTGANFQQNVFVVCRIRARRPRTVVDQDAVGEEAAQRGLELMVVRIDEARHHDAAGRVDHARAMTRLQIRPNGEDLRALDQHVARSKVTDGRIHRHDVPAANDIKPPGCAAVLWRP